MLGKKMRDHNVKIWLVNTGWSGGEYGVGQRMSLKYTRAMITAALNGQLDDIEFHTQDVFGLNYPASCPGVPNDVLNPVNTWDNKDNYYSKANMLAKSFIDNFEKFQDLASDEILAAAPIVASFA